MMCQLCQNNTANSSGICDTCCPVRGGWRENLSNCCYARIDNGVCSKCKEPCEPEKQKELEQKVIEGTDKVISEYGDALRELGKEGEPEKREGWKEEFETMFPLLEMDRVENLMSGETKARILWESDKIKSFIRALLAQERRQTEIDSTQRILDLILLEEDRNRLIHQVNQIIKKLENEKVNE